MFGSGSTCGLPAAPEGGEDVCGDAAHPVCRGSGGHVRLTKLKGEKRVVPGMVSYAGEGPAGAYCKDCIFLGEAAVLSRSLADANAIGAMEAYQSIGCASFLIDKLGQVLRFNQAAERLFGDGLELSHGRLRARVEGAS